MVLRKKAALAITELQQPKQIVLESRKMENAKTEKRLTWSQHRASNSVYSTTEPPKMCV
jgi:hypothetical protein